jgi:hypothetical protein
MELTQEMLDAFVGGWMESHVLSGDKYTGNIRTDLCRGTILSITLSMGELWFSLEEPERRTDNKRSKEEDPIWKEAPELLNFCTLSECYRVNNIRPGFGDSDAFQLYNVETREVINLHSPAEDNGSCPLWLILEDADPCAA